MSELVLWRVEVLSTPPLAAPCARCRRIALFESRSRFRVNAQQGRIDVWLLYRCRACDRTAKRRLHRRRAVAELAGGRLEGYLRDDAALARAHAFELPLAEPLPYRVERPPLPGSGLLRARIHQPHPSGARWDRFLARELGWSRSRVARAWHAGQVAVAGVRSPSHPVADRDLLTAVVWKAFPN